jgi:hypothetical protein
MGRRRGEQFYYDDDTQQWFSTVTAEPVPEDVVFSVMHAKQDATYDALDSLTAALYTGTLTLAAWEVAVAQELREAHLALALFAVGGARNMTPATLAAVSLTLASQFGYLHDFARDIALGGVTEAMAKARARMYGNTAQKSYWDFYTRGARRIVWQLNPAEHCPDCLGLAANSPYTESTLPTVPGAGDTRCRSNCKCTLSVER